MTLAPNLNKYRTTKDIVVPKGTLVIFIAHMKQDIRRAAQALISHGKDRQYTWLMDFDEAIDSKLIEKIPDG